MAVCASLLLVACAAAGCEIVLGDLPPARDTQSTTTGSTAATGGTGGSGGAGGSATTSTDTSSGGTTTGEGGCCDCDHDTHLAKGPCGGDDCDDHDPTTHPGADYSTDPTAKGDFDHDCSGAPDPDPTMNIAVNCGVVGLPCKQAKDGFLGKIPECGKPGAWGNCQGNLVPCSDQIFESNKKLACK
jgi:hypothetical protein